METIFYLKDSVLVARLSGEIDHHVAEKIRRDIDEEMKLYGVTDLILDFSNVTFMDSSGIGVVLGRYKKVRAAGGTMKIRSASRLVRQILDMSGVFSLMEYEEKGEDHGEEQSCDRI
ncbi:MAG: anti-sigma F factor antagonist [Emergencia sp.]